MSSQHAYRCASRHQYYQQRTPVYTRVTCDAHQRPQHDLANYPGTRNKPPAIAKIPPEPQVQGLQPSLPHIQSSAQTECVAAMRPRYLKPYLPPQSHLQSHLQPRRVQRLVGGAEGTPVSQLGSPLSRMSRLRGWRHLLLFTPPAKRAHHQNRLVHAVSASSHMTHLLAFAPELFSVGSWD